MERYKKTPNNKKPHHSIDGFLDSSPRKPVFKGSTLPLPDTTASSTLNDLSNKKEGFTRRQPAQPLALQSFGSAQQPKTNDDQGLAQPRDSRRQARLSHKKDKRAKRHSKHHGVKVFVRVFALLIIVAIGLFGFVFGKAWWDAQKAFGGGGTAVALNKELDPNTLNGEGDGRVNILLLGKGGDAHEGGQLTDTLMIASVDPVNHSIALVSLPRDLWVTPKGLWSMKINAVYHSAKDQALRKETKDKAVAEEKGIAATETVVEEVTGVKINYYAMVDFTAFQEMVDTLGGITVNLPEAYSDSTMRIGKKMLNLPAGPNELDGATALGYARSRYGAARGDFDRGGHQQLVIMGIKDKVLSMGTFVNPLRISQLTQTFGNRVKTNFSTDDMMKFYEIFKEVNNESITNIDLAMEGEAVVKTGTVGGQSVVLPLAGEDNYSRIQAFLRLKLVDSFIVKETPSIIVLNGSGKPGAATKRAEELKSYGYNVIQVADAPTSDVTSTQLIDTTNGAKKYTKRYLELRFDTQAVDSVEGIDPTLYIADYIVVIGQNG